jgi:seryl-tRNA synthetase
VCVFQIRTFIKFNQFQITMLDIKYIKEHIPLVKENMAKKNRQDFSIVDQVCSLDDEYKKVLFESQQLRTKRNSLSQQINLAKKQGQDTTAIVEQVAQIPTQIAQLDQQLSELKEQIVTLQKKIPVIMHESVPLGNSDADNVQVQVIGTCEQLPFEAKSHQEIAKLIGGADFDSSAQTSGTGFYYIQGDLALLNQALLRFALEHMVKKGFTYVETPYMLRNEVIKNVVSLADQDNQIYKIEHEDLYLIGTSEHSLIGRYLNQVIPSQQLPVLQTSYSMCFRREKGSHGLDERGLYRTHQFNKIEMIGIVNPDESMKYYEFFKQITCDLFTALQIPIRILAICSGDLGDLKHVQIDVEAYSPRRKGFFEVASCSNLVDAQARQLGIKSKTPSGETVIPHTLNNTCIATSRALVAILENNQQADGSVRIPPVLVPYMFGKTHIPVQKNNQ